MIGRTYAIGDVQGCLAPLKALLTKINYDPNLDTLWFTGDLLNRGPQPLATMRFIKALPANTISVLGNHDLALLAASENLIELGPKDTMSEVLTAPDKDLLIEWLRQRPLLHHDPVLGFTVTHAGIFPAWDLAQAQRLAHECETILRGNQYLPFLQHMYGNHPTHWQEDLSGWDRLRFITNAFTRMRFITAAGDLELSFKGSYHSDHLPWFAVPNRKAAHEKILFGHWAALEGQCNTPLVYPLDSGCVWGKCLTAFCLETEKRFTVDCLFLSEQNQGKVRPAQNNELD